jgi:hypothetical protein
METPGPDAIMLEGNKDSPGFTKQEEVLADDPPF